MSNHRDTKTPIEGALGRLVMEHAPCWLWVVDERCQVIWANGALEASRGTVSGERCYRIFKGRERPCEICVAARARETGEPEASDEQGMVIEDRELRYRVCAVPICSEPDQEGSPVLLLALDMTREHELAAQLSRAERLAAVGLTTAGLAHSIKNILAGLEGGMYLMRSGLEREDRDRVAGAWEMVGKYIEQVSTLVKNLLSYAKEQQPQRELVKPARLVAELVELYESKAEMIGIRLVSQVSPDLPEIDLDYKGIHGCLANLVANALDACAWDPDTDKEHTITIGARPGGETVIFEVSDNGMGISEENRHKILRSSFTTKGMRGTGLGLLLTQKVIQEHRGSIRFDSELGKGTSFTVELPATISDQAAQGTL